jgi:hypothetical protein
MSTRASLVAVGLALSAPALASTRTVCYEIQIADSRSNCPTSGDGVRRACVTNGGTAPIEGFRYEVWDKDSAPADDDFIASYTIGSTGRRCFTFTWEGTSAQTGDSEAQPDVYLKLTPTVRKSDGSGINLLGKDGAGTQLPAVSWRDGVTGNVDAYVAADCTNGTNCDIAPGSVLVPVGDSTSSGAKVIMALDTAQRPLQWFSASHNCTSDVDVELDTVANLPANCSTGCTLSRTLIGLPPSTWNFGDTPAHEVGHVFQECEFGIDDLRDNCNLNGAGWSPNTLEWESCATQEGFASWVSVASWYNPAVNTVSPQYFGFDMETPNLFASAGGSCSTASSIPGQATKAFWDLSDSNNENSTNGTGDDSVSMGIDAVLNAWGTFSSGTNDRQQLEQGANGCNLWDYQVNNSSDVDTTLNHNCMSAQQFN